MSSPNTPTSAPEEGFRCPEIPFDLLDHREYCEEIIRTLQTLTDPKDLQQLMKAFWEDIRQKQYPQETTQKLLIFLYSIYVFSAIQLANQAVAGLNAAQRESWKSWIRHLKEGGGKAGVLSPDSRSACTRFLAMLDEKDDPPANAPADAQPALPENEEALSEWIEQMEELIYVIRSYEDLQRAIEKINAPLQDLLKRFEGHVRLLSFESFWGKAKDNLRLRYPQSAPEEQPAVNSSTSPVPEPDLPGLLQPYEGYAANMKKTLLQKQGPGELETYLREMIPAIGGWEMEENVRLAFKVHIFECVVYRTLQLVHSVFEQSDEMETRRKWKVWAQQKIQEGKERGLMTPLFYQETVAYINALQKSRAHSHIQPVNESLFVTWREGADENLIERVIKEVNCANSLKEVVEVFRRNGADPANLNHEPPLSEEKLVEEDLTRPTSLAKVSFTHICLQAIWRDRQNYFKASPESQES